MKIRHLKTLLFQCGYHARPGKGSHSVWSHPSLPGRPIVLHGKGSDDAHPYQIARVCKRTRGLASERGTTPGKRKSR